jgi:16S rRNA (cytosine1402-N4)-methyltransferase
MDVRNDRTASRLLNEAPPEELVRIFKSYGELGNAFALATAIVAAREEDAIETTGDLEEVLKRFIPRHHPSKFLAKVYQALRIEVNREMEALGEMLLQTAGCMKPGGRLVVITYHSIEDRIVKNYMRSGKLEGEIEKDFYGNIQTPWKLVNRSVITPSEEEIRENNRARSAKLRIAERTES